MSNTLEVMNHGHFHLAIISIHPVKSHPRTATKIVSHRRRKIFLSIDFFSGFKSGSDLEAIARRHGFEPLYDTNEKKSEGKFHFDNDNLHWMNTGIIFTDKTIEPDLTGIHHTGL